MDWIIRQHPLTHCSWALLLLTAAEQFVWGYRPWGWVALSGAGAALMWVLFERYARFAAPRSFIAGFAVFVVATLLLGEIRLFYDRYPLWDIGVHTFAGACFGAFGALLARGLAVPVRATWPFAILFAIAAGTMWEVFEFAVDVVFDVDTQGRGTGDTMHDILCNLAGGLVGAWAGRRWREGVEAGPERGPERGPEPVRSVLDGFVRLNPHLFAPEEGDGPESVPAAGNRAPAAGNRAPATGSARPLPPAAPRPRLPAGE